MTTLRQDMASFIEKNLIGDDRKGPIDDSTSLIEEGILDSMGLMQMVAFLEERTGVRVPDDEVSPDNFENLPAIEGMVERLRGARGR